VRQAFGQAFHRFHWMSSSKKLLLVWQFRVFGFLLFFSRVSRAKMLSLW
jgi:hypothetical protein